MTVIFIGVALMIGGIVWSTVNTLRRGRLSRAEKPVTHEDRDTLEPSGRGDRLDLQADLPGLALFLIGAVLILAGAIWGR
ncbi:MAG: hypothetical protein ACFBQW_03800 [Sphingomonadaceae bacterium]